METKYFLHRYKKDNVYMYKVCECEIIKPSGWRPNRKSVIKYYNEYYKKQITTCEWNNKIVDNIEQAKELEKALNYQLECKREYRRKIKEYENRII